MTNKEFECLLKKSIKKYGGNYVDLSDHDEPNEDHVFSRKFNSKMKKFIKKNKKTKLRFKKHPVRRVISIAVAFITIIATAVAGVASASPQPFVAKKYDDHTELSVTEDNSAPETFEDIYEITDIPEGFEVIEKVEWTDPASMIETDYRKDDVYIFFAQHIRSSFQNFNIDTERDELEYIQINDCPGVMVDYGNECFIAYDNGDYIIEVLVDMDKETAIKLAESVQKVEK